MQAQKIITIELPYFEKSSSIFERFSSWPYPIFLDSCSDYRENPAHDVISAAPYLRFIVNKNYYEIIKDDETLLESGENALTRLHTLESTEPGSLMGYLGYHCTDHLFQFESTMVNQNIKPNMELPDICVGFYSWRIEINNIDKISQLKYIESKISQSEIENIISIVRNAKKNTLASNNPPIKLKQTAESNLSQENYYQAFEKIKTYIQNGDCYQINLAQRFTMPFSGNAWQHYQDLRCKSPAPYACFFSTPFGDVLCFSPESFLKIDSKGKIVSQPIKGTRKRHKEQHLDLCTAQELASSEKDKAENLMIVDLIRNDLSKNSTLNSVKVDKLFEIQSFANVHHMVSQISAQKSEHKSHLDVLIDCFPGGSITGAPKKRAMEIIRELEPHHRQVYCGAIGQISFENKMEFNIAIRTILIKNNVLYCWGGGGLVADSIAEDEYQESILKISNLIPI